jgi:hypothetical protein
MILVEKGAYLDMNPDMKSADQKNTVEGIEPEGTLEDGASGNVYIY